MQESLEVAVTVSKNDQAETLTCNHLLAADGCRSTVRKLCGLDFPGSTNPHKFLIVDVEAHVLDENEHHFHFNHPTHRGHTLLMVPQPEGIWRLDWQLPLGTDADLDQDAVATRVRSILGAKPFVIKWVSCYQFHQRIVPAMTVGNVHLVGDSAHLVNPFGGRGMNAGIQDARSIAGKLIRVINCGESPTILNTYSTERRTANLEHQRVTRRSMGFIAPQGIGRRLARDLILRGSRRFAFFRKRVDSGRMSMVSPLTHDTKFQLQPA